MSRKEKESLKRKAEIENKEDKTSKNRKENDISDGGNEKCQIQANKVIYFKIVYNEEDFNKFQNLNFENCFQPTYTYELFKNEIIHGYKGLKILISLTPKTFYAHINIKYGQKLPNSDNLDEIFANHFKNRYTTDKNIFISELIIENDLQKQKGKLIFENEKRKIYNIDILNDDFTSESYSLQALCTFFIDAASFIPLETNFWGYFLVIEYYNEKDKNNKWHTIGFTSYKNFHVEYNKYYTMLSQFLVLPPYQRKGVGTFLLENFYKYLFKEDKGCLEITTEDPDIEFILMRDYTICKILIHEKLFDHLLKLFTGKDINSKNIYDKFILDKKEITKICKKLKLQENLISRAFEIIKYGLVANNKELSTLFEKDKKANMIEMFEENSFEKIKLKRIRGPYIFFHDDLDYNYKTDYQEESSLPRDKRVEMLYPEYIADVEKITPKVYEMVLDYKLKLN